MTNENERNLRFYPPFYSDRGMISRVFRIIDYRLIRVVMRVLGTRFLSESDKEVLKEFNFDLASETKKLPPYQQAMVFGRLAGVLTSEQIRSLHYADFYKFATTEQIAQLTFTNQMRLGIAATRTYTYIKGLGDKMKKDVAAAILGEAATLYDNAEAEAERVAIQEAVVDGSVFNHKKSITQLVSDLGHRTEVWEKDWLRILETEMQNVFEEGTALSILDLHGDDALVYKSPLIGACSHCIKFFLTNGFGSKPRIFKLKELYRNGTNIDRPQSQWLPTVGPSHPFCRCSLQYYDKLLDWDWNEKERMFKLKPLTEETRKVKNRPKVHIQVGTKEFDV